MAFESTSSVLSKNGDRHNSSVANTGSYNGIYTDVLSYPTDGVDGTDKAKFDVPTGLRIASEALLGTTIGLAAEEHPLCRVECTSSKLGGRVPTYCSVVDVTVHPGHKSAGIDGSDAELL